jgi:hypothetical protein
MIKLELNEKLWFGKYNGIRLIDIIKNNSKYIDTLINIYKIDISDDAYKLLKNKPKKSIYDQIAGNNPQFIVNQVYDNNGPDGVEGI